VGSEQLASSRRDEQPILMGTIQGIEMATLKLYDWNKCTTCRDYRLWLKEEGVEFDQRDFFKEPFTEKELRKLVGKRPLANVFSWNSPSFKELGVTREELSADEPRMMKLMLQEPRLIRRPMVQVGRRLVIGSKKEDLKAALK